MADAELVNAQVGQLKGSVLAHVQGLTAANAAFIETFQADAKKAQELIEEVRAKLGEMATATAGHWQTLHRYGASGGPSPDLTGQHMQIFGNLPPSEEANQAAGAIALLLTDGVEAQQNALVENQHELGALSTDLHGIKSEIGNVMTRVTEEADAGDHAAETCGRVAFDALERYRLL